ncbi:serine hydrolase domain-containing protein [Mesorhizobium sp. ES1-1]|uniref:serine hydrolase domain-containing protein n=1 Tax=Mesorhizobium sp. ES1-1 TaxID=2876629 RepID=UPI001CCDE6BF|nr:serine hydrolase domain-containing protein [Mesorhizobium sp. ES1-1]MBZ9676756.1 beta-lactamase family protein [Mesorhizobium sp. ES1-1]
MDENHRLAIEELVSRQVRDKRIPSISYALTDREGVLATGHVTHSGAERPLDERTLFRIGSLTKMFTAIGIMQLAERGMVDIDAPVSRYIPGFNPENPFRAKDGETSQPDITLRKLMSHTAGLVREAEAGHYLDDSNPPLAITVDGLKSSVLKADPHAGLMHYSNAGIAVAGAVIERVSGLAYDDYVRANILLPLGMDDTHFSLSADVSDRLAPASMWTISGDLAAPVFDLGGVPAGNVYSTVSDMTKFASCLLRGGFASDGSRVVSPASLETMWRPVGRRPAGYTGSLAGYGLGFGTGNVHGWKSIGHGGAVYGYASQLLVLPHAGLAALVFSTLDFSNQIADRLARRALQVGLAARKMGTMPKQEASHLPLSADHLTVMPGLYHAPGAGETVELRASEGRLYLMGEGVPLEVRHSGGESFIIDGRIYGPEADYPYLDLSYDLGSGTLTWKDKHWTRKPASGEPIPETLQPHLGVYGPAFNPTYLSYADGRLHCLIEYFCSHHCEPLTDGTYRMHGLLYEGETLELDAVDAIGRAGIRVGPMFLARKLAEQI